MMKCQISIDVDDDIKSRMQQYAAMAKGFMNKPFSHPNAIVGNYEWHQKLPYEKLLLCRIDKATNPPSVGDVTDVVLNGEAKIVDFGCGPGRMVDRMKHLTTTLGNGDVVPAFARVDGIDVSDYALDYARSQYPDSKFYNSSGIDCGEAPTDEYDWLYSTICIQHIASRTIRRNIYSEMCRILKPTGSISIQVAFHPTYGAGMWSSDTTHSTYMSDFFGATATNGHADMVINERDLTQFKTDLEEFFKDVEFVFAQVDNKYDNLDGTRHAPYWASHWLFVHAAKK